MVEKSEARFIINTYSDGLGSDGVTSGLVFWVIQYGWVCRKRGNNTSSFRPDDRRKGGGVKSAPEVGVYEVHAGILDLRTRQRTDKSPLTADRRSYLENDVAGTLLRERLVGLFDDIDVSGLGVRDSLYGFWELGHGCVEDGDSRERKISRFMYESDISLRPRGACH